MLKKKTHVGELVSLIYKVQLQTNKKNIKPQQKKKITKETQMILKCRDSLLFVVHIIQVKATLRSLSPRLAMMKAVDEELEC